MAAKCIEVLEATKSYRNRGYAWTPSETRAGEGRLEIDTVTGRQVKSCVYGLVETISEMGRAFRLVKLVGAGTDVTEDTYDVLISGGRPEICTCRGFSRVGKCKHGDACASLLENRWI